MARPVRARPTSVYRPRSGVAASRQSWRVHCARLPQQRSTRSALCHPCYFPEGRTETLRCRQPQAPTAEGARLNPKATAYVPLSSDGKGTQNHQCCARGASCHGEPFAGPGSLDPSQKRKNFMVSNTEDAEGAEEGKSEKLIRDAEPARPFRRSDRKFCRRLAQRYADCFPCNQGALILHSTPAHTTRLAFSFFISEVSQRLKLERVPGDRSLNWMPCWSC